jgi:hypothetical protein
MSEFVMPFWTHLTFEGENTDELEPICMLGNRHYVLNLVQKFVEPYSALVEKKGILR